MLEVLIFNQSMNNFLFNCQLIARSQITQNIYHSFYNSVLLQLFYSDTKLVYRRKMKKKKLQMITYKQLRNRILVNIVSEFHFLKERNKLSFIQIVIIHLHKVQTCQIYHKQLLRCSMPFSSKNLTLAIFLAEGLLRYWPFANSVKEAIFFYHGFLHWNHLSKNYFNYQFSIQQKLINKWLIELCVSLRMIISKSYLRVVKYSHSLFSSLNSLIAIQTVISFFEIDYKAFVKEFNNNDPKFLYTIQDPKITKRPIKFEEVVKIIQQSILKTNLKMKQVFLIQKLAFSQNTMVLIMVITPYFDHNINNKNIQINFKKQWFGVRIGEIFQDKYILTQKVALFFLSQIHGGQIRT
ncbi:unnamed protein product [Paramecium pentaurelia]|uniref:Uncharacterized protein n=1 Tax=Paramecium pentaurelia TaxID=43138 RepID=A0A8S1SCL2_9CILI|nr:unnamed protein product [Paramecium pentaurelia]